MCLHTGRKWRWSTWSHVAMTTTWNTTKTKKIILDFKRNKVDTQPCSSREAVLRGCQIPGSPDKGTPDLGRPHYSHTQEGTAETVFPQDTEEQPCGCHQTAKIIGCPLPSLVHFPLSQEGTQDSQGPIPSRSLTLQTAARHAKIRCWSALRFGEPWGQIPLGNCQYHQWNSSRSSD